MTTAVAVTASVEAWIPRPGSDREWPELSLQAPHLVVTMRRYLLQLTTFLAPRSVDVADGTLRQFARWLVANTDARTVADISRVHIEDYKVWLAGQPGTKSSTLAKNTQRQRLRMISTPTSSNCSPTGPPPTTNTSEPPVGYSPTGTHP